MSIQLVSSRWADENTNLVEDPIREDAMAVRIGYLLPTRESVMEDHPEVGPLLTLGERAETLGYDSLWVGDSLMPLPRHEPITLLAAVAARAAAVRQQLQRVQHGDLARLAAFARLGGIPRPRTWHMLNLRGSSLLAGAHKKLG